MAVTTTILRVGDLVVKEIPEGAKKRIGFRFDLYQTEAMRLEVWADSRRQLLERLREIVAGVERLEYMATHGPSLEDIAIYARCKGMCSEGRRLLLSTGMNIQEVWEYFISDENNGRHIQDWLYWCECAAISAGNTQLATELTAMRGRYFPRDLPHLRESMPEAPIPLDFEEYVAAQKLVRATVCESALKEAEEYRPRREARAQERGNEVTKEAA